LKTAPLAKKSIEFNADLSENFWMEAPKKVSGKLFGRHWRPLEASKGTIILVHGYSEHSGRYGHFAKYLTENHLEVMALDLPGHGRSDGRRSDIKSFHDYIKSVEALILEAQKRKCATPFHLIGHSLGGLVAIRFAQTSYLVSQIKSITLSSPLLGLARFKPSSLPWLKVFVSLLPNITIPNHSELEKDILTHDPVFSESRLTDPLIKSCVTPNWVSEIVKERKKAFEEISHIHLPMAMFQAGDERVVSREEAERFMGLYHGPKLLQIYEGFFHEILNEIERERVMSDMLKWVQSVS